MQWLQELLSTVDVLVLLVLLAVGAVAFFWWKHRRRSLPALLKKHFSPTPLDRITITERQFPTHMRADLQRAIEEFLERSTVCFFFGIHEMPGFGGADFTSVLDQSVMGMAKSTSTGPPQFEQIDIGEDEPILVLKNGVWLVQRDRVKFAVLYALVSDFGECGVRQRIRVQVAAAVDENAAANSREFFKQLEAGIFNSKCYRGKVLSLEHVETYTGQAGGVKVHKLGKVDRDAVILSKQTLDLLDRNVVQFVERRRDIGEYQMSTKKGLLFYGPPGTGKTHTIRYLAGSLSGHTTLLIAADQVTLLSEYLTLARLLQPSIVVIEDVDLIARERTHMRNPAAESLLNRLLNEMDGLTEDCEILFILTTNRPEELERALASRPGRIDQAIEFPLPDAEGRAKLVRLYARGIEISEEVTNEVVRRTERVSASFIKELMRRSAQFQLERKAGDRLSLNDVEQALDEMLFSGGSLNLKLLGAEPRDGDGLA